MTDEDFEKRLVELRGQVADVQFVPVEYAHLRLLVKAVLQHLDDIDAAILGLEDERVAELANLLPEENITRERVTRHLSHLDMFDLERLSLTAEGYHGDLGGQAALGMTPDDLTGLTQSLRQMRHLFFPTSRKSASGK